ncbi:nitrogen permease regulator of amino acid transport activity 3-domain-containing protein, partial [Auriculariales sp. MPI-PUGE-AT-0066]
MAETLIAILLVTSSGVATAPCLASSTPERLHARNVTDVLWRSAFSPDFAPLKRNSERPYRASGSDWQGPGNSEDLEVVVRLAREDEDSYGWQPPTFARKRALFQPQAVSSGRSSPVVERTFDARPPPPLQHKDDMIMPMILGYPASALASLLAPANLCHQKFELLVDELVFIGHPVCRDPDGSWPPASTPDGLPSLQDSREESPNADHQHSLHLFHVVFVLDRPDASSASSGNLAQYYDIIYRHIAFKLTAALYAEQGARALVDNETEYLEDLKQKFLLRDAGEPAANKYKDPVDAFIQAARECSIASAIQQTYTAIKNNRLVDFTIGKIRVQIQLPPSLDSILHDSDEADYPSDWDDESRG